MKPTFCFQTRTAAFVKVLLCAAWVAGTSGIGAQPAGGNDGRQGPPPQALDACKSLESGAACSFTSAQGTAIKGTCQAPQGRALACRPANAK